MIIIIIATIIIILLLLYVYLDVTSIPISDNELQAELKALCNRIIASQHTSVTCMERYEKLLLEIYKRNLIPEITLTHK